MSYTVPTRQVNVVNAWIRLPPTAGLEEVTTAVAVVSAKRVAIAGAPAAAARTAAGMGTGTHDAGVPIAGADGVIRAAIVTGAAVSVATAAIR